MNKRVDIKLGYQCNNFCRFCIVAPKRNKFPNKSAGEVKDALKKARDECNGVIFMGGEPTIQKNLIYYVKYAKDLNYEEIHITSNGRMFSLKDYCRELSEKGEVCGKCGAYLENAGVNIYWLICLLSGACIWIMAVMILLSLD